MTRRFFERRIVDEDIFHLWRRLLHSWTFNVVCYFEQGEMLLTEFNLTLFDDVERTLELEDIVRAPKRGKIKDIEDYIENRVDIYSRLFIIKTRNITRCLEYQIKKNTILMLISNRMLSSLVKKRSRYGVLSRLFTMFKKKRPRMLHLEVETSLAEIKGIYSEDVLCSRWGKILVDPIKGIYSEDKTCTRKNMPREGFIGLPNPPPALLI
jgi:hypothetical protein